MRKRLIIDEILWNKSPLMRRYVDLKNIGFLKMLIKKPRNIKYFL